MTVDRNGSIWLAGKKRLPSNWPTRPSWIPEATWIALQTWFKPYSLVKLVAKTERLPRCELVNHCRWCVLRQGVLQRPVPSHQPVRVDGDAAAGFVPVPAAPPQGGVLAIEDLRNVLFFPDTQAAQPITISGGWNTSLKFGELLQDVTLLQLPPVIAGGARQNFVLATTTQGRVLSKNTATGALPTQVFNIPTERTAGFGQVQQCHAQSMACIPAPPAAIVFVTDRAYCQVAALVPNCRQLHGAGQPAGWRR